MEDIDIAASGDIVAMFGIDCNSGDTFTDGSLDIGDASMFVPEPVISLTVTPKDNGAGRNKHLKALRRFTKEDPTFRVRADRQAVDDYQWNGGAASRRVSRRMKREYAAEVVTSPPRVAYRETVTRRVDFSYTHKKQTGGSGQYGKVCPGFLSRGRGAVSARRPDCGWVTSRGNLSQRLIRAFSPCLRKVNW